MPDPEFNLDFTFQNKGRVAVTNMVVTVDVARASPSPGLQAFYVGAVGQFAP